MLTEHAVLFEPLSVKGVNLRNRIVLPPMVSNRDIAEAEGVDWYREFAEGGVGLVIVEATRTFRFDTDLTPDSLRPLVESVHQAGAAIAIQLFMAPEDGRDAPAEMTREDVQRGLERFARAAAICEQAGFDGVEPHGAHGFLLNQFFSPKANERTDEFGGGLDGRMRMGLEVVRSVRSAVNGDFLVLYRHTPVGDGYGLEDSLIFAQQLEEAGVDILDLSPSSDQAPADRAEPFKQVVKVPLIAVNGLNAHARAVEALTAGRCDLVAIGRGLIADPEWPKKTLEGRLQDIVRCTQCDQGCFGNLRSGLPVECVQHD
ncbi:MAG: NADH:flavin oxidoreductase [Armatimonadetes bacterium]|nr:NADH:flavin oxidoreductase [Armatimonadota bacterium]